MPQVGFKLMTTLFKQAKTVHALDHIATIMVQISYNY
jgi:hypothetical protein